MQANFTIIITCLRERVPCPPNDGTRQNPVMR